MVVEVWVRIGCGGSIIEFFYWPRCQENVRFKWGELTLFAGFEKISEGRAVNRIQRAAVRQFRAVVQNIQVLTAPNHPFVRLVIVPVVFSEYVLADVISRRTIGRASCRERVCQYVSISGVDGLLKKKRRNT